jgi:hypothetical protein
VIVTGVCGAGAGACAGRTDTVERIASQLAMTFFIFKSP